MNEPKPVRVQDVIDYHQDKDACHICERREWDCPQHPFNPNNPKRLKSAVDDGFRPAIPWKPPNQKQGNK